MERRGRGKMGVVGEGKKKTGNCLAGEASSAMVGAVGDEGQDCGPDDVSEDPDGGR